MNSDQLIRYIYNNIDKVPSPDNIIIFINSNNIPYSENNNGIFINISLLNTEILRELYELIISESDKEIYTNVSLDTQENKYTGPNILVETKKYKDIRLTPLQVNLLKYSR